MSNEILFGVIGGSGLYSLKDLTHVESIEVDTPFGKPSSPVVTGEIHGKKLAFLARHGIGHVYPPSEVNYRANIYAMKQLGVKRLISISACGSLRADYAPGEVVIPDQIFDFTHKRERSFFGTGLVVHVGTADPFCHHLSKSLAGALREEQATVHEGGTYITIEGPRFSTKGESQTFRHWGMSLVGMTASPEVFLAREAEMCYATMAHVTDYDVWHVSEEAVSVDIVIRTLEHNTDLAQRALVRLADTLDPTEDQDCSCQHALENAFITNRQKMDPAEIKRLGLLVSKYLD